MLTCSWRAPGLKSFLNVKILRLLSEAKSVDRMNEQKMYGGEVKHLLEQKICVETVITFIVRKNAELIYVQC